MYNHSATWRLEWNLFEFQKKRNVTNSKEQYATDFVKRRNKFIGFINKIKNRSLDKKH